MQKRSLTPWPEESPQHSSLEGLLRAVRFCNLIKRHNTGHTPSLAMALSKCLLNEYTIVRPEGEADSRITADRFSLHEVSLGVSSPVKLGQCQYPPPEVTVRIK